jgi:hypothetical protein
VKKITMTYIQLILTRATFCVKQTRLAAISIAADLL